MVVGGDDIGLTGFGSTSWLGGPRLCNRLFACLLQRLRLGSNRAIAAGASGLGSVAKSE